MTDQFVTTFTNEDVQHELFHTDSSQRILRRISSPLLEQSNKHCHRQGFHLTSVDVRLLESRIAITTVRTDTIDARSARSACVHTAIVNISALMDGEKFSSASQCVSNVVLFSLAAQPQAQTLLHTLAESSCSTTTNTAAPLPC